MKMLKEDSADTTTRLLPPPQPAMIKRENSESSLLGKDRYKLWMLAALLLLAIWTMLTGTLTLKTTAAVHISASIAEESSSDVPAAFSNGDDLDVLEVVERQKIVERFWKLYIHGGRSGGRARLPMFWEDAFQAAFDSLVSDSPAVRDDAVAEIAKMSLRSVVDLHLSTSAQSTDSGVGSRKLKLLR